MNDGEYNGPDRRQYQDDGAIQRSVEAVVRKELAASEERMSARVNAIADDMRSEIRALRRMDEALSDRVAMTEKKADGMQAMNEQQIKTGVRMAVREMLSPGRIVAGLTMLLGLLIAAMTFAMQAASLVGGAS